MKPKKRWFSLVYQLEPPAGTKSSSSTERLDTAVYTVENSWHDVYMYLSIYKSFYFVKSLDFETENLFLPDDFFIFQILAMD